MLSVWQTDFLKLLTLESTERGIASMSVEVKEAKVFSPNLSETFAGSLTYLK